MGLIAGLGWVVLAGASVGSPAPALSGGTAWLGSPALSLPDLKGKVVLVEFWTFRCWNCRNLEPHVKEWHDRYRSEGLVVIGVHTPELDSERDPAAVKAYLAREKIDWPVLLDPDYAVWNGWGNRYWPALYLVDKRGILRYLHVGEGEYPETAARIEALLEE